MIRTYGLFWKSEWVDWEARGQESALLGKTKDPYTPYVDFRDQRGIFALYSQSDLVYVGQTGSGDQRLLKRLRARRSGRFAERWDRFSWFGMRSVRLGGNLSADAMGVHLDAQTAMNVMEAVAMAIAKPQLNRQSGEWGSAQQYFQVKPEPDGQPE